MTQGVDESGESLRPDAGTVTAITRQRRHADRVNVFLDGEFAFAVSHDEAVRNNLFIGRLLDPGDVASFRSDDEISKAVDAALRLLTIRPRTEQELRTRLAQKPCSADVIDAVISRVQDWGYLDDGAFARFWIANRIEHRPKGKQALRQELRLKGVAREIIEETIDEAAFDEVAAARALAEKRLRMMTGLDPAVIRRRLTGQLARRGFSYEIIGRVLTELLGETEEN